MKVVKIWVAQDHGGDCFAFKTKPINYKGKTDKDDWRSHDCLEAGYLGKNLLNKTELKLQPIQCQIITENHLRVLEMD